MRRALLFTLGLAAIAACPSDPAPAGETDTTQPTASGEGSSAADGAAEGGREDDGTEVACEPALDSLHQVVFVPRCGEVACHDDGPSPAAGLDLVSTGVESRLLGESAGSCESGGVRVVPGDRASSLLYTKLLADVPCGERMPSGSVLPDAHIECVGGWIDGLPPLECETCGGENCIDLQDDAAHCGACNRACPAGVPCHDGTCSCPDDQQLCGDACVSTASDPAHCGGCDDPCGPGLVCLAGTCTDDCGSLTECTGACVDLQTDPAHCGACDQPCASGGDCIFGSCDCPGDGVSFAADIEPILVAECAGMGCHGSPNASADLDLRSGLAHGALVGVSSTQCVDRLLVAPGNPGASYLMDKLEGVNMCFGTKMPKANQSLTAAEIVAISEWICRGAADD